MLINNNIKERLLSINWFSHCGEPEDEQLDPTDFVYVTEKFMRMAHKSVQWQNCLVEATGYISGYLSVHHSEADQLWSEIVRSGADFFDTTLHPIFDAYRENLGLDDEFMIWTRRAIIGIITADYYRDLSVNTRFYDIEPA